MRCPYCDRELRGDPEYCRFCGKLLKETGEETAGARGIDMSPYDLDEVEAPEEEPLPDPGRFGRRYFMPEDEEEEQEDGLPAYLIPLCVAMGCLAVLLVYLLVSGQMGRYTGRRSNGGTSAAAVITQTPSAYREQERQQDAAVPEEETYEVLPADTPVLTQTPAPEEAIPAPQETAVPENPDVAPETPPVQGEITEAPHEEVVNPDEGTVLLQPDDGGVDEYGYHYDEGEVYIYSGP